MPQTVNWTRIIWICAGLLLPALVCCRKPADAEKSDLREAGYTFSIDDWLRAAADDDVPALRKFLAAGFDAASTAPDGQTALHAAAAAGAMRAADFLLDRKLPVNERDENGRTPLMSAVLSQQPEMTGWLLRQGADPLPKDDDDYNALMLAVREDAAGPLAEIAPYHRENLDSALLLAALMGRAGAIDTLTNYGASVYARMDDGRTPLMLAAENGHADAVELLIDLGASRFSTDQDGRSAADLATTAGHPEIVAMILHAPQPYEFAFESPDRIAQTMESFVDAAQASHTTDTATAAATSRPPARPIEGEVLSAAIPPDDPPQRDPAAPATVRTLAAPPLVMRHYREREVPLEVRTVGEESATIAILGKESREVSLRPGDPIPGSNLVVTAVRHRVRDSKLTPDRLREVSVVDVRDTTTGATRNWITGLPASAHDPVALVEDAATGRRYTATPGQRFRSGDGAEFIVTDVRPNQLIIEDAATGEVQTLTLRGPRG